jgi:flagellar hook-basal body complex protein FliE
METTHISPLNPLSSPPLRGTPDATEHAGLRPPVSDTLKHFLSDVNTLQFRAAAETERMIAGQTTDLHQVMIAVEKATTGLAMVIELRNRAIESYREILRVPL